MSKLTEAVPQAPSARAQLKRLKAWLQERVRLQAQLRRKVVQGLDNPGSQASPLALTAASAAEDAYQAVLDYLEELASEEEGGDAPVSFAEYVAQLPGPHQTGELGIVFNADDEDEV